jgi:hypothetical protein
VQITKNRLDMRLIFERLITESYEPKVRVTDEDIAYHISLISQDESFQPQLEVRLAEISIANDE